MRKWILGALAAVWVIACPMASAQYERPERPFSVRVGVLWPTDSGVRELTSDTWFNVGLDYALARTPEGNEWVAALDYGNADNVNYWALQGLYMWRNMGAEGIDQAFSFGVGGGLYILDPEGGDSQSEFGIPLVGQWDFNTNLFLQGKYHWVISESDANAFGLQLGYRF